MPKEAVLGQRRNLSNRLTSLCVFIKHELEPLIGCSKNPPFDGEPPLQMCKGVIQRSRCLHFPVDTVNVSSRITQDLENLFPKSNRLYASLTRRSHGFIEAAPG